MISYFESPEFVIMASEIKGFFFPIIPPPPQWPDNLYPPQSWLLYHNEMWTKIFGSILFRPPSLPPSPPPPGVFYAPRVVLPVKLLYMIIKYVFGMRSGAFRTVVPA